MKIKIEVEKCLLPFCDRQSAFRGLCSTHYMCAARLVKKGETTWQKLIQQGKAKKSVQGRHHCSPAKKFFLDSKQTKH